MASYATTLLNRRYAFPTLADLLAKASPPRSGDELAGLAAADQRQRVAAQTLLADVPLSTFIQQPLIDPDLDDVSALILQQHDSAAGRSGFSPIAHLTVGALREHLLSHDANSAALASLAPGLTPEIVAAVSKICRNQDLILIASKCRVITRNRSTLGLPGTLSTRLQPNHPTDDPRAISAAIIDGLLYGSGDACIGINPATDNVPNTIDLLKLLRELIDRFEIPTQSCVLAHLTTTLQAIEKRAPVDLIFQSIAGTQRANESFGISLNLLREASAAHLSTQLPPRNSQLETRNFFYFETGQGSALSANAHHGIDQQTLEARAYAVAREFDPLLVNTVVGFIGPEYLYDGKQILRAALEDHFCGKLLGLPMGVDVCYTNHALADQDDMDSILTLLATAGVNYVMAVPGADDVMLGYQSTSHHDAQYLRQLLALKPAPEFEAWLDRLKITNANRLLPARENHPLLSPPQP
jgi:ethanolamine ammonia-lyase large subunit